MAQKEHAPHPVDTEFASMVESVPQDSDIGRPVRISWFDSGLSVHGWRSQDDIPQNISGVESVGLWMGENDQVIMIAGSRDNEHENWLNVQLIWKPSITRKEWL